MRQTRRAHYLRHNKVTRVPRHFFYLDTEANRALKRKVEVQTFRLACVGYDRRRDVPGEWSERIYEDFATPRALWEWIGDRCTRKARNVLVAHNLAYDLRISKAFEVLPDLGWHMTEVRLDRGSTFAIWKREDQTLEMVDSFSWFALPLERVGEMVGVAKLALPDWNDTDDAWRARCRRDVQILGDAWRVLIDWIKAEDLGSWKPTSAGQAYAAFRHRFMTHQILSHDDDELRSIERRSAWTGRCEVYRHGVIQGGPFAEWDYSAAYASVAASCAVPVRLVGTTTTATVDKWRNLARRFAVLAEIEVDTEVPTLPCERNGRILWPVGTFRTVVWENELRLAIEEGANVRVSRMWWYERASALADFGGFVLARAQSDGNAVHPLVVQSAKHWGRALVGRFGARWSRWETCGDCPDGWVGLSRVTNDRGEPAYDMLHLGTEVRRKLAEEDSPDSVVALMAWVMAECRVRLWSACVAAGWDNVAYVDTDGLIVTAAGTERLRVAAPDGLRLKREYPTVEVLAPRQIVLSGELRAAGIPRRAVRVAERTYEGEVWSELSTSFRTGRMSEVAISTRRLTLSGNDERRIHNADGTTSPRRIEGP